MHLVVLWLLIGANFLPIAYQTNLGVARSQFQAEPVAVQTLEQSKGQIEKLLSSDNSSKGRNVIVSQWQSIVT